MTWSRRSFLAAGVALAGCHRRAPRAAALTLDERRRRHGVPGVALAFVTTGGAAVLEAAGDLTADTVVEVASLSKPVFAYAVLAEAARGGLDIDAPLAAIAAPPYRHVRRGAVDRFDDPRLATVTPRLLLSHRAGLPNWSRDRPLGFVAEPGARWGYSGEGYVLLQRALEARGVALDAFVRERVLAPRAMAHTTFDPRRAGARAAGHDRSGAVVETTVHDEVAATSLLSTAADLGLFARGLLDTSDPVVDAMVAPQVDVDRERGLSWGTGIALARPDGFFHWGANPGVRTLLVGSRARGEALAVVTTSDRGMELAADLVRERFGDLPLLGFPMLYPPD